MRPRTTARLALISGAVLVLSGCSSSTPATDTAAASGRGPITYVQGKDNSNVIRPLLDKWNAAHPNETVTFKEQTDKADQQHDDLVQNFQAKNVNYDVVSVDVVWTAEFAAKGWLYSLKDAGLDTAKMLTPTVKAATYNGTLFAAPVTSDGGMLYYRSDLVPTPPKTITELLAMCSIAAANQMGCFAGQYAQYEGLTVNAAEAINTAGGVIVGDDGKTPAVDTPEARKGLSFLADAYKAGVIPKEGITFQEEQGRQAFEAGKLLFHRNWPYVYSLASKVGESKINGKFGVAPLPGLTADKPGASSLGGHSAAISAYSKNKATAVDFVKFLTSEDSQRTFLTVASNAPVLSALYDDPALNKQFPYLSVLKTSIANAVPRPVTPFYPAVTKAVQDNAYAAIKGDKTVDQAIKDMQAAIKAAGGGG